MFSRIVIFTTVVAVLIAMGYFNMAQGFSRAPEPMTSQEAAKSSNQFGWDLYQQLKDKPGNLFFSPASIDLALIMTWSGALDQTARDMGRTLNLPDQHATHPDLVLPAFGQLQKSLLPVDQPYSLHIANRLWGQSGFKFKDSFLKPLDENFSAGLQELDFRGDSSGATQTINQWVEEQTEDKIQDLIPSGSLGRDTRLVLTNAIYFLGKWQRQFKGADTSDRVFHLAPSQEVRVSSMHQNSRFLYGENDQVQLVALPYLGGGAEMLIVLPRQQDGLAGVEANLDQDQLDTWANSMTEHQVKLWLPKFSLEDDFSLSSVLGHMGMASALSPKANFTGMAGDPGLFISEVIHKSFIDVYEKGTEAAAATAVTIRTTSMGPLTPEAVTFDANHPFVFMIRDVETQTILFMGRVMDPGN